MSNSSSSLSTKDELKGEGNPSLINIESLNDVTVESSKLEKKTDFRLSKSLSSSTKLEKLEHIKYKLKLSGSLATTGAGVQHSAVLFDPSGTTNWSSLANLYDEFRVTSAHLDLYPAMVYDSTTVNCGFISVDADNDSNTPLSAIDQSVQYGNSKQANLRMVTTLTYHRPDITKSAYWVDVASPSTSLGCFHIEVTGSLASVTVLWTTVTYEVEFRSIR
jgi:hypothetical protein